MGGVDLNGPTLHTVYPHGSTDKLPYVTMGRSMLIFVEHLEYYVAQFVLYSFAYE